MDRRYSPEEISQVANYVEDVLSGPPKGYPTMVVDTVLLMALVARLDAYGEDMPPTLTALREVAKPVLFSLLRLCAEGPYEGLPVA